MKFTYKATRHYATPEYELITPYPWNMDIPFCCDAMREGMHDRVIVFGRADSESLNIDKDINIYTSRYYYGDVHTTEYAINYCPFCGEKIEVQECD